MNLFENEKKIQTIPTSANYQTLSMQFLLSKKSINVKNKNKNQKLLDIGECVFSIRKEIKPTVTVNQLQSHQETE